MNREDIIRMAKEAGFHVGEDDYGDPVLETNSGDVIKFAQLVAAHERDACAQIVDIAATKMHGNPSWRGALEGVAFLIRART